MKLKEFLEKDHPYYKTAVECLGEFEVMEHLYLKCSETLTQIFLLLKLDNYVQGCPEIVNTHSVFCFVNYLGVGIGNVTNYKEAKLEYDNAINNTKRFIGIGITH